MTHNPEKLFSNVLILESWHIGSALPEQRLAHNIKCFRRLTTALAQHIPKLAHQAHITAICDCQGTIRYGGLLVALAGEVVELAIARAQAADHRPMVDALHALRHLWPVPVRTRTAAHKHAILLAPHLPLTPL